MPPTQRSESETATAARRLAVPAATLAGVAAAFGYVGNVDPNHPGHYPVCPFLALTGLYCPACGGLRGAYALVHGDLTGAVHDNALAIAGYAVCAVLWALWAVREARGRAPTPLRVPKPLWWALGAVVLAFTVLRNLPLGAALAP
jgi:hypothetical protein